LVCRNQLVIAAQQDQHCAGQPFEIDVNYLLEIAG
jgi:hypothetical protein